MKEFNYPTNPTTIDVIDVVIPYTSLDVHLVNDAIDCISNQSNCLPYIHLVADGCDSINHRNCINYKTVKQIGPYWIVNLLTPHFKTGIVAIQDADDISYSNRLWKQIAVIKSGYIMTSCAMQQVPIESYTGSRHIDEPILYPGMKMSAAPWGRNINSVRTFSLEMFKRVNGFGDYPMSGDFQFDARVCSIYPDLCHYSLEVLATRRLRPMSLSNHPDTGFKSETRHNISWKVMSTCAAMRRNTTLTSSIKLGYLDFCLREQHLLTLLG